MTYITHLRAENFKRVTAVDIDFDPAGGVTTISGPNGAGKTSVIDALASAIAGKKAPSIPNPIRKGEDHAIVIATTDTGLVITRKYTRKDDDTVSSSLTITNAEGFTKRSPQTLLDELLSSYALDPLAFASAKPEQQKAELMGLVDLPFDPAVLDAEESDAFDERTQVNRQVKELAAQLAGMPPVDASAPAEEVSAAALLQQLQAAQQGNAELDAAMARVHAANAAAVAAHEAVKVAEAELMRASTALEELPQRVELDGLQQQVESVDSTNATIRANAARIKIADQHKARDEQAKALTAKIAGIKKQRADGLARTRFPVAGLGFDETGVTFGGVPFSQASAGERLTASIAIAAAANPGLRLVLVRDAALLDGEHREMVRNYAEQQGLRIVMEVVADGAESGVVISDGTTVGTTWNAMVSPE